MDEKPENFVKSYIKRVLAFKALHQLRVEVDKIGMEEAAKKKHIKIITLVIALIICFALYVIFFGNSSSTVIDEIGRVTSRSAK